MLLRTVMSAGAALLNAVQLFFVLGALHASIPAVGLLEGVFAAGVLGGTVLAPWCEGRLGAHRCFLGGSALTGLLVVAYSRTTDVRVAGVAMALTGVALAVASTTLMPLVLRTIPDGMVGRVSSTLNVLPTAAGLLATGVAGWLLSAPLRGVDASVLGSHLGPCDTLMLAAGGLMLAAPLLLARPVLREAGAAVRASH